MPEATVSASDLAIMDLAEVIRRAPARCGSVRLVAIDGPGGAGKSVFAERLARHLGNTPVIHTDDFASWDNPVGWWGRLEGEVLGPVERGTWAVRFRAYDWEAQRLGEWREIPASDVILLEGVSSSRQAVAKRLTLALWVEAPATAAWLSDSSAMATRCAPSGSNGWPRRTPTSPRIEPATARTSSSTGCPQSITTRKKSSSLSPDNRKNRCGSQPQAVEPESVYVLPATGTNCQL